VEGGANEVGPRVVEHRDQRQVAQQDALGLAVARVPGRGLDGARGGHRETVVVGAGVAGLVFAAVAEENGEEGERVDVVADPAGPPELQPARDALGVENFSLLVVQVDVHAEMLSPHLLDDLGDFLVCGCWS